MYTDRGGQPINKKVNVHFPKKITKKLFRDWGPLKAYIVPGKKVREGYDLDFTEGGNFAKYAFVPKDEIWLDDHQGKNEIFPTLLHELIEYASMVKNSKKYNAAHKEASIDELKARKNPSTVRDKVDKAAESLIEILGLNND